MAKQEIVEHIEKESGGTAIENESDLETTNHCANCGKELPYEEYNQHSPQTDFVTHTVPGDGPHTPPIKKVYCSTGCFVTELKDLYGEALF